LESATEARFVDHHVSKPEWQLWSDEESVAAKPMNFRSWPGAVSWDGFQKADIRNPLILPTTAFWRHA
jgi:hypothetical protein